VSPAENTWPVSGGKREHRVLRALAEADDADGVHARLRLEVLARREDVLRFLPAERLQPVRVAVARLRLEVEVALVGGEHVVATRVQERGPPDHRRIAVRIEAVHDNHARVVAGVEGEHPEERRTVTRVEEHERERRRPRWVAAVRDRARRVVLGRERVRDDRVERRIGSEWDVIGLVRLGQNLVHRGRETVRKRAWNQGKRRSERCGHDEQPHLQPPCLEIR